MIHGEPHTTVSSIRETPISTLDLYVPKSNSPAWIMSKFGAPY